MGNKVLIPKVNENILVVKVKDTDLIKIYNLNIRRFVRKFTLTNKQMNFTEDEEIEYDADENKHTKIEKIIYENALNKQENEG